MDTSMNPTDSTRAESPRPETSKTSMDPIAQSPKRIYRDPKGPLGGVAGGFAGYFDVDPVIVRLLWLVALLSGIGLPAYILCWLVIPKAKSWPPAGYQGRPSSAGGEHRAALLSGFAVIALAAAIGAGVDGIGEYLLPAALVGFGVYLLNQRARTADEVGATAATAAPVGESELVGYVAPSAEPVSARAGRTGLVTPTVISLLAIGTGVVAALHAAGLLPFSVTAISAGGLVLVGGGLIASLWLGRARGLVPLGLGLATVMLGAATLGPWVDRVRETPRLASGSVGSDPKKDVGDRFIMPQSLGDLQPSYGLGAGKLELDLTALDFTGETRQLELTVGAGEATILVPPGVSVVVQENVGVGKAEAFGSASEGVGVRLEKRDVGTGAGTLEVELNVGLGHGQVQRGEF